MIAIIWEYIIDPTMREEFEHYYHDQGVWAQCFRRHPDYIKTQLIQDRANNLRYITIDYWLQEASFEQFHHQYRAEYEAIDAVCAAFTTSETRIGIFEEPAPTIGQAPFHFPH